MDAFSKSRTFEIAGLLSLMRLTMQSQDALGVDVSIFLALM